MNHPPGSLLPSLRALDLEVIECEPVFGSGNDRAGAHSFRLVLADGAWVKAQILPRVEDAMRVETLLAFAGLRFLPLPIGRSESILLLPWIPGEPLDSAVVDPSLAEAAGAMLAAIHQVKPPPECRGENTVVASLLSRLPRWLDALVQARLLGAPEAALIESTAARFAPPRCAIGLTHSDWCGENLVQAPDGSLCAIDNETLILDAYAFDLARTWSRWPLPPVSWTAFLGSYRACGGDVEGLESFPFWAIMASVTGAYFRLTHGRHAIDAALIRLRPLLTAVDGGMSAGEALLVG